MSTYTRTIGYLDAALDVITRTAPDLTEQDREPLQEAARLVKGVRNRLVGADHDEDRHKPDDTHPPKVRPPRPSRRE